MNSQRQVLQNFNLEGSGNVYSLQTTLSIGKFLKRNPTPFKQLTSGNSLTSRRILNGVSEPFRKVTSKLLSRSNYTKRFYIDLKVDVN